MKWGSSFFSICYDVFVGMCGLWQAELIDYTTKWHTTPQSAVSIHIHQIVKKSIWWKMRGNTKMGYVRERRHFDKNKFVSTIGWKINLCQTSYTSNIHQVRVHLYGTMYRETRKPEPDRKPSSACGSDPVRLENLPESCFLVSLYSYSVYSKEKIKVGGCW